MTQAPVISLRSVSKKYQLYDSLSHRVYEALHPFQKKYHREFWALRDIDFDIPRGATVGILGVNGSGKSTLLQIICSILQPTAGTVAVRGKVAALIELGAGFNPELTGRENAELNGTIQGLDRLALRERLPEIQAFADIGEFYDQPVRTYSSGMLVRVAFATAIHVDPDILVIDEALAVGDARFQQKCFRKFRDFQAAGKTILLVTHDRSAVPRLCSMGMLLDKGCLLQVGSPKEVTDHYSRLLTHGDSERLYNGERGQEDTPARLATTRTPKAPESASEVLGRFMSNPDPDDRCSRNPTYNKYEFCYGVGGAAIVDYLLIVDGVVNPIEIESARTAELYLRVRYDMPVENPLIGFSIKTREGALVYGTHSGWLGTHVSARGKGEVATYKFAVKMNLGADDWFIDLAVARSQAEVMHTREGVIHVRTVAMTTYTGVVSLDTTVLEL